MKLTLGGITGESGIQSSLFSDVRKREQLKEMMRQLEVLLGCKPPIYQMKEVEPWSRIPERRQALVLFDP
jgi:DNA polymerase-4/protein ImuB